MDIIRLEIKISDPWDFGECIKWETLHADVVSTFYDKILLRLLNPFLYKGVYCEYFVSSPRHEEDSGVILCKGKSLFCNLTCITPEKAKSLDPFDLNKWRGGFSVIANIKEI